jgi:hypothetical protein
VHAGKFAGTHKRGIFFQVQPQANQLVFVRNERKTV